MLCEIFVKMSMLTQNAQNSNTKKMKRDQNTTTLPLLRHCTYHSEVILLRKNRMKLIRKTAKRCRKRMSFALRRELSARIVSLLQKQASRPREMQRRISILVPHSLISLQLATAAAESTSPRLAMYVLSITRQRVP